MKVLAIGAHPDDVEIGCGGTLALFAQRGDEVTICHMSDGSKGSLHHTSEEIARIRRKESIEAANVIGANSIWGGLIDGEIILDLNCRMKVIDVIRQVEPDLIITNPSDDYHTDHINLNRLVFEAIYMVGVPLMETEYPPTTKIPALYYMDSIGGINFLPTEYVDISSTIDLKIEMMKKMPSQLDWLGEVHDNDPIESIRVLSRFRGFQIGVKYAEGFRHQQSYMQGLSKRLLP